MPSEVNLNWQKTFRVIPSKFPPINFFEELVSPDLMEELFYVENLTNDRLRDEVGDIFLVPKEDRVSGNGSSVVMASFTHVSRDRTSRFSDGSYGIYYAAREVETALRERAFHSERFLSNTKELPGSITMRVYQSKKILKPLLDIRGDLYANLQHPTQYADPQAFGLHVKNSSKWGIVYNSVRHKGGECIAILRPPAIPLPVIQTQHFNFVWDGQKIHQAFEIGGEVFDFQ